MTRFKKKFLYTVQLGYKRPQDRHFNAMHFSVVVSNKNVEAATEKAKTVMMNWPGANCRSVEIYSAALQNEECY